MSIAEGRKNRRGLAGQLRFQRAVKLGCTARFRAIACRCSRAARVRQSPVAEIWDLSASTEGLARCERRRDLGQRVQNRSGEQGNVVLDDKFAETLAIQFAQICTNSQKYGQIRTNSDRWKLTQCQIRTEPLVNSVQTRLGIRRATDSAVA